MMDSTAMDDVDCGNLYDQIDDLNDYPLDNECSDCGFFYSGDCKTFPSICNGVLANAAEPFLLGSSNDLGSDLSAEISVPNEDSMQLEWLPSFMADSFWGGNMDIVKKKEPSQNPFLSISSPVSVLERSRNNRLCSLGLKFSPITRARTKRPRPATFGPCSSLQLLAMSDEKHLLVHSEGFGESKNGKKYCQPQSMEETKKTMKPDDGTQPFGRCQHCRVTKTPLWRCGPMGPRTLCNACGVRYNSGRLLPQYRPSASPTFVPDLHSNSHRKVIEMRNKLLKENFVTNTLRDWTKRPRSETFYSCTSVQLTSTIPPSHENHLIDLSGIASESEESENGKKYLKLQATEEKLEPKIPSGPIDVKENNNGAEVKRCQRCMIAKTLHWRDGSMGPETLCNACWVCYNSQRLFPEHCPAASSIFAPNLNSNSHRKVGEMRDELVNEKSVDVTKRARTKCLRPATFSPRTSIQLTSPNPPSHGNLLIVHSGSSLGSEGVKETENGKKCHEPQAIEEKMITPKISLGPMDEQKNNNGTQAVIICQHCAITKTTQWRQGPMGPKTLCNACGVRYRSGRLFPEYRPAASPTFVPYLHSNRHKNVIEMRNELVEEKSVDVAARVVIPDIEQPSVNNI